MNHIKDFEKQNHVIGKKNHVIGKILMFQLYVLYYLSVSESLDIWSSLGKYKQPHSFLTICHPKIYSDI